jgi:hypothetical protein
MENCLNVIWGNLALPWYGLIRRHPMGLQEVCRHLSILNLWQPFDFLFKSSKWEHWWAFWVSFCFWVQDVTVWLAQISDSPRKEILWFHKIEILGASNYRKNSWPKTNQPISSWTIAHILRSSTLRNQILGSKKIDPFGLYHKIEDNSTI